MFHANSLGIRSSKIISRMAICTEKAKAKRCFKAKSRKMQGREGVFQTVGSEGKTHAHQKTKLILGTVDQFSLQDKSDLKGK